MDQLHTFKEISIGGVSKEQLLRKLADKGIQFNKYANILFDHFLFLPLLQTETFKLVKIKISDLGIDKPCFYQEITNKAAELGLQLCPLYIAAFLRLAYLDQPEGPYLTIASAKPEKDENHPNGFYIRNLENILWLRGYRASDDYEWPMDQEFIFLKK